MLHKPDHPRCERERDLRARRKKRRSGKKHLLALFKQPPHDVVAAGKRAWSTAQSHYQVAKSSERLAASEWSLRLGAHRPRPWLRSCTQYSPRLGLALAAAEGNVDGAWAFYEEYLLTLLASWEVGALDEHANVCRSISKASKTLVSLTRLAPDPSPERAARIAALLRKLDDPERLTLSLRRDACQVFTPPPPSRTRNPKQTGSRNERLYRTVAALNTYHGARWRLELAGSYASALKASRKLEHAVPRYFQRRFGESDVADVRTFQERIERAFEKQVLAQAEVRLARVALEFTRDGTLPATAPADFPRDPFAPKRPLGYRRTAPNTALIWSVGLNRIDEQGGVAPRFTSTGPLKRDIRDYAYELKLPLR